VKYSAIIQEHFQRPRNVGILPDATATGEATNEACLDHLRLYIRVRDSRIEACTFQAEGCVPTIAVASVLTEYLVGRSVAEARTVDEHLIEELVQGLPRTKKHAAILAVDALRQAVGGPV
jgi:NifU-like protein involved in Fe-S cluster formation